MKQLIKVSAFLFAITLSAFVPAMHNPVGHWKITYTNGASEYVDFYKDGTYKSVSADGTVAHQGNSPTGADMQHGFCVVGYL